MSNRLIIRSVTLFIITTMVFMSLWLNGLEVAYARVIVFSANSVLSIAGSESNITIEKEDDGHFFRVRRLIDGKWANYPQMFDTLLLPFVMILSWQVFSAFYRKQKHFLRSAGINIFFFLALQTCFLLLLTVYYTSSVSKYLYDVMLDSFYIIAMGIIIIDYIRYPLLTKKKTL